MNRYDVLVSKSLNNEEINIDDIKWIMESEEAELLPLLHSAFKVRSAYFGSNVKIHVIENVKSGNCSEDCFYCAQSHEAENEIEKYPVKKKEELLKGAMEAFRNNAFRYCMVFSGSRQDKKGIDFICDVVKEIKEKYKIEVCVSAGFISTNDIVKLKEAGVNRYNHNLNTSEFHYGNICKSHQYSDRYNTIKTANENGLEVCSGIIAGMGETLDDIYSIVRDLKKVKVKSVPINFFIPIKGHRIRNYIELTPVYCLKLLCVFRFALPDAEIRCAGGREYHLRSLQSLCLYPANSIFARGYLTTGGDEIEDVKKMITDAGFVVECIES